MEKAEAELQQSGFSLSSLKIERGSLSVALVCMVLGFMLAVQFRSTQDIKSLPANQRIEDLTLRVKQLSSENQQLKEKLSALASSDDGHSASIHDGLMLASGQTAVKGPGVIVTLDDSKKMVKNDDPNLYLIHDEDMLKVINELRAAGAEAISINGQRLTGNSEIRCAGPTISVNNVRSAPPFEIRAIGSSRDLLAAINMRGGVADTLKVWGITVNAQESKEILIPAYKAASPFKYAEAANEEGT
jgi:uncharacterized protein YlxW (UPF0749 family)